MNSMLKSKVGNPGGAGLRPSIYAIAVVLGLSGGLGVGGFAAETSAWVIESGPYMTVEARPKQVVIMHDSGGRRATVVRMKVQTEDEGSPGAEENGWRTMSLPGTDWARILAANWGALINAAGGGYRYQMQVQGQGVGGEVLTSAWAAGQDAYSSIEQASHVSQVHSKSPEELTDELWCSELDELTAGPEPKWWVRPGGLVNNAVMARTVEQGKATGVEKRFASPLQRVFYLVELAKFQGSPEVQIRWYEGDKEVAARTMVVYGGGTIWGSLQASGDGLSAGRYAVEITSVDGKEMRLEFLVEPAEK